MPLDAKYQQCELRMNVNLKRDFEKVVMMGDATHLVLFSTDSSNKEKIKGSLIFKCPYRSVLNVVQEEKDPKRLLLTVIRSDY